MGRPRISFRITLRCALLATAALVMACGDDGTSDRPADRYRVRGLVRQLPPAGRPEGEIHVRHEAIPDFKDADGAVVGMESMTMPFPIADPGQLAGIEVGSRIEMEFEVRWDAGHPLRVTTIEALPPDTRLGFEEDLPPDTEDGGAEDPASRSAETGSDALP